MLDLDFLGFICFHHHLCMLRDNLVAMWSLLNLQNSSKAFLIIKVDLSLSLIVSIKSIQPQLQLLISQKSVIFLLTHLDILFPKLLLVSNQLITLCLLHFNLEFQQFIVLLKVICHILITSCQFILNLTELALLQLLRCNQLTMHTPQHRILLLY
jgi:hypothetical protein